MKWKDVTYRASDVGAPAIDRMLDSIRRVYVNGGVVFKCFKPEDDATFDLASRNDLQGIDHIYQTFLRNPSVRALVPELGQDNQMDQELSLQYMSAFALEGQLTALLLAGGAYKKFEGTVDDARQMSRNFTESLFGDHFLSVFVAMTNSPWTEWFYDVAWDSTFIALDQNRRTFWLLCLTDTD